MTQLHFLLFTLLLTVFSSCNGQVKTNIPRDSTTILHAFSKLKSKEANIYDNVHCGLQDKLGNLWFGTTKDGVFRYDGNAFTQFNTQNGLQDNFVWKILQDKNGNVWIGTSKGLCYYDGKKINQVDFKNNNSMIFSYPFSSSPQPSTGVYSMIEDGKGILWFGTNKGIICYDGNTFTNFFDNRNIIHDSTLTLKSVQFIFEDKKGNIWFASGPDAFEGICMFDGKTIVQFKPQNQSWIRNIIEDSSGNILFVTRHQGIIKFDGKVFSNYTQPASLDNNAFTTAFTDSKGNIWYGSDYLNDNDISIGGVWKFDGKTFTEFTKQNGLSNTSAFMFLEDRNGAIWIGTRNTGLFRYEGKTFTCFSE